QTGAAGGGDDVSFGHASAVAAPELRVVIHELEPADSIEALRDGRIQLAVSFAYNLAPRLEVAGLVSRVRPGARAGRIERGGHGRARAARRAAPPPRGGVDAERARGLTAGRAAPRRARDGGSLASADNHGSMPPVDAPVVSSPSSRTAVERPCARKGA